MSAKKILVVCQHYSPEPFRVHDMCVGLRERGYDVTVLTGLPNYPTGVIPEEYRHAKNRYEERDGVKIIRCSLIPRGNVIKLALNYVSFMFSSTLKARRIKEKFDVVLAYQTSPVMMANAARAYARKNNARFVLYCLDIWPDCLTVYNISKKSLLYRAAGRYSRRMYASADKLFISSPGFYDRLAGINKKESVEVLPQYTDETVCDSLTRKDGMTYLLFAGNIGRAQDVQTILYAADKLRDVSDLEIHIVGDGSSYEECKNLASRLALPNVVFHGRVSREEMSKYYARADALLLTLRADSLTPMYFPAKLQTYLAQGKPIISAANGVCRQLIDNIGCGYTSESGDSDGMAQNIKSFIADGEQHKIMGTKGRRYSEEYLGRERFFKTLCAGLEGASEKCENV